MALREKIHRMPVDERRILRAWEKQRIFHTQMERTMFLKDCYDTVTREMLCQAKCCANLTRDERLASLESLQGGSVRV